MILLVAACADSIDVEGPDDWDDPHAEDAPLVPGERLVVCSDVVEVPSSGNPSSPSTCREGRARVVATTGEAASGRPDTGATRRRSPE